MGISNIICSILIIILVAVLAEAGVGCLWPGSSEHRVERAARQHATRQVLPVEWPSLESCAEPERPLTVLEAHRAMQTHRDHSCARKRAAFTTLIAAGRIVPDSSREARGWRRWWS